MSDPPDNRPLKLVAGDNVRTGNSAVRFHLMAHNADLPFPVDAIVEEQDTYLVLAVPAEVIELPPAGNRLRTMTQAHDDEPCALGSVIVAGNTIRAVVVNVDADEPCNGKVVAVACEGIVKAARRHKFARVLMPLLGTQYGGLSAKVAAAAIAAGIARVEAGAPLEIVLFVPGESVADVGPLFGL